MGIASEGSLVNAKSISVLSADSPPSGGLFDEIWIA